MKKDRAKGAKDSGSDVILEQIDSKLDRVVEGQQGLQKQIDENHEAFEEFREETNYKLGVVIDGQQGLQKQITDNHEEFREFRKEVDYKFGVVIDELHVVRNELKEKVGRDEFVALEKRVIHLEKKSAGIERKRHRSYTHG